MPITATVENIVHAGVSKKCPTDYVYR